MKEDIPVENISTFRLILSRWLIKWAMQGNEDDPRIETPKNQLSQIEDELIKRGLDLDVLDGQGIQVESQTVNSDPSNLVVGLKTLGMKSKTPGLN